MSFTDKKVLLFINSSQLYLLHRMNYAMFLKEKGFQVYVVVPKDSEFHKINQNEINIIPFQLSRKSLNPFLRFFELIRLIQIYKRVQPYIIHNITVVCIFLGSLAALFIKPKYVFNTFSGLGYIFEGRNLFVKILRFLIIKTFQFVFKRLRTFCFTENREDLELLRSLQICNDSNSLVVPGAGVDINKFTYIPEDESKCKILFPARMLYEKGVMEFYEAAKILKLKYPFSEFILAGRFDPENPNPIPKAVLLKWNQEGFVTWLGEVEDMVSLYHSVNIICLPSYREGLPMSLIEACASGRVVVTTNVKGCKEVILRNNGILVPPRDPEKLALALETLILDPKLRVEMGREARRVAVEFFSQEKVFNMIYEQILKVLQNN